jgi:hypothetical protein
MWVKGHMLNASEIRSNLASRVKSGKGIVYTGTITKATTYGREQ